MTRSLWGAVAVALGAVATAPAQDPGRVQVGIEYQPGSQPGLLVVAGPGLDSIRKIVDRDLGYSDRFTMVPLPDSAGRLNGPFNPQIYRAFRVVWAVELQPAGDSVDVKLYEVATGVLRQQTRRLLDRRGEGETRLAVHRVSDQVVLWITGQPGIAASRIAFKMRGANRDDGIFRMDSDGANLVRVTRGGGFFAAPAWSPDGTKLAYSEFKDGVWELYVQTLATGARQRVTVSSAGRTSLGAEFSPDGTRVAFQYDDGRGANLYEVDAIRNCCATAITTGTVADNISPTYSPDGRRIAYVSTAPGSPQIYVIDADGTNRESLVSAFEGASYTPEWSPDGSRIVFGRDVGGVRQVFTYVLGSGQIKQWTSTGSNQDPNWAPDSRHVVYKSSQTGREQLWVMDLESSSKHQLATPGAASYPAWSRILTNP